MLTKYFCGADPITPNFILPGRSFFNKKKCKNLFCQNDITENNAYFVLQINATLTVASLAPTRIRVATETPPADVHAL